MAAPVVVSTNPAPNSIDVVLGSVIEVVFDQPLDPTSVSDKTFAVYGPGQTSLIDADDLIVKSPTALTGREFILGTVSLVDGTTIRFVPSRPLQPSVKYQVTVAGAGTVLSANSIKNLAGEKLAKSFGFEFTTGTLDTEVTPPSSPLPYEETLAPWDRPVLDPNAIVVKPARVIGNNLAETIELVFPAPIDQTSFNQNDLVVAVEAALGDPLTVVPPGLQYAVAVSGASMFVTVSGWDTPDQVDQPGSGTPRIIYGFSPPLQGYWEVNDRVYNLNPNPLVPGQPVGWICVTAGEPGVWEPMDVVSQ